ncbi:MAG: ISKra4 family transposase, partial [Richelia sp.]|nr:ISKra4 family transposase [Richelia sp.]
RGADAVLALGSLHISGDWDEYWQFHLQEEHKRNHLAFYSSAIPLMKQVLKACCSTTPSPLPILL